MRRLLAILAVGALVGGAVMLATGSKKESGTRYWIELDNAFGLIRGGDLKVAGVRAGKVTRLELDQHTHRALVEFRIDRGGFGSLRADASCETRPQSLIGEYFLDCDPGTSPQRLKAGGRIPVQRSASTVPPDLLNDIMRRPYKQRFSIIIGELGAGLAGRGADLNAALRRASPALRQTDRVLDQLASESETLKQLAGDADRVIGDLAHNRKDVGRWVIEARDTAQTSAKRRAEIAGGFKRLPGFLEQLRPAMVSLDQVAREQTPALRNLDASAKTLDELFGRLSGFADVSRPAFRALAKASDTGSKAVASAGPVVDQLASFSAGTPELGRNLAAVLEHLDDRQWAVEADPRSPGGKGYTGIEALLTYVYDQALSTNIYDGNGHYLKVALDSSECQHYSDIKRAKTLEERCGARVGPHAIGFNFDDTTDDKGPSDSTSQPDTSGAPSGPTLPGLGELPPPPASAPAADAAPSAPAGRDDRRDPGTPAPGVVPPGLPNVLPGGPPATPALPSTPTPPNPGVPHIDTGAPGGITGAAPPLDQRRGLSARASDDTQSAQMLLDYLLGS